MAMLFIVCGTGIVAAAGGARPTHASCKCGDRNATVVDARSNKWVELAAVKGTSAITVKATGLAAFSRNDQPWYEVLGIEVGKAAANALLTTVCPECGFLAGFVDQGVDRLKRNSRMDKFATPYGNDPKRNDGYGSKKCGGLLISLGSPGAQTGECPCSGSHVYHLVTDGRKRFGDYSRVHRYITAAEIARKSFKSVTIFAKTWDSDHSDNIGQYGVTVSVKPKK